MSVAEKQIAGTNRRKAVLRATSFFLAILLTHLASAQTFSVIYKFTGGTDGAVPQAGLTVDVAGNLYGTTISGGFQGSPQCRVGSGCGAVFKLVRRGSGWTLAPIYNFRGGLDASAPLSRVVIGHDGNLYGTSYMGGIRGCLIGSCGTVYRLSPPYHCLTGGCPWNETVLYFFAGGDDGATPQHVDLVFDGDGNIYGTTALGGGPDNLGTVFELRHSSGTWVEGVLYRFSSETGATPPSGVVFDHNGNLYGTLGSGTPYGFGAVYTLTPQGGGWTGTTLFAFQGGADGAYPFGGLTFDSSGNLYGTTAAGGPGTDGGTVYKMSHSGVGWTLTTLTGIVGEGGGPTGGQLTMDAAGNLYGTTYSDGANRFGSVFKLAPQPDGTWLYTDLYDFTNHEDGSYPVGGVAIDSHGNLFGTASFGGDRNHCAGSGCGVVWMIVPWPVSTPPSWF